MQPIGVDTGVNVQERLLVSPGLERHRVVFWPRTTSPVVLITNRRRDAPVLFSRIRVSVGGGRLDSTPSLGDDRLLAAFFDKPLFPENFGSDEQVDVLRRAGSTLDDWQTFYRGGKRLAEYVKHAGFNSAVVCVARDGGALYPSQLLQPTPLHDYGVFFATAQDPVRKDVLEMLFRIFDREGLVLIPALHLSGTLPELERIRREGGAAADGILLRDPNGRSQFERRSKAAYYNATHPAVQAELRRLVEELVARYQHHKSFGGLALQLSPETCVQIPDQDWALDDATLTRFLRDTGHQPAAEIRESRQALLNYFATTGRRDWLAWRAAKISQLHLDLADVVTARRNDAKLILAAADSLQWPSLKRELTPQLYSRPSVASLMLRAGIDPKAYRQEDKVQLLRPFRHAPQSDLRKQAANITLNGARVDEGEFDGSLLFHEPQILRLEDFDRVSPFGADSTFTRLFSHFAESGSDSRARFARALAEQDPQILLDGGWMLPLGQEDSLLPLMKTFRALPSKRFERAKPSDQASSQPIVVRHAQVDNRTYIYQVNTAPWPVSTSIELSLDRASTLQLLDGAPVKLRRMAGRVWWDVELEAYGVAAAWSDDRTAAVVDWTARQDQQVNAELQQRVEDVLKRANSMMRSPQLADVDLPNPKFDAAPVEGGVAGWQMKQGPNLVAQVVPNGDGGNALRLRNDSNSVLWCRSEPLATPATGSVTVVVRLKIKAGDKQPNLRVALDSGRGYYDIYNIGKLGSQKLDGEWAEFAFHFAPPQLDKLMVGFDLMEPGEVLIDEVRLYDLWLDSKEASDLVFASGQAGSDLRDGAVGNSHQFLNGYWPRFLQRHVRLGSPQVAQRRRAAVEPTTPPANNEEPSTWDRVRNLVPRVPRPQFKLPFSKDR